MPGWSLAFPADQHSSSVRELLARHALRASNCSTNGRTAPRACWSTLPLYDLLASEKLLTPESAAAEAPK